MNQPQSMTYDYLERRGHKVLLAMNLAEARVHIAECTPDLILLNLGQRNSLDFSL